jgi:Asp-tRNA(Asn)/Glu-tRNA(Gln) amidotransferase A subunit family amidase
VPRIGHADHRLDYPPGLILRCRRLQPSYERISRAGVIPLSPSLDHVGVFTTDVAGAALAASLLCRDWKSEMLERKPVFGIPEGPYLERASDEGLTHFRALCHRLREAEY